MRLFILSILLFCSVYDAISQCTVNITCRPTPPAVECSCEIPDIPSEFIGIPTDNSADIPLFEGLGFGVSSSGNCGQLYVTARDRDVHPQSCQDTFYTLRTYNVGSSLGGVNETCTDTFFTQIAPPHFLKGAIDSTITCKDDVENIFNDYVVSELYTDYLNCQGAAFVEYLPSNPILATSCGGAQSINLQINLSGPCFSKCGELAKDLGKFVVTDTFVTVITCPILPPIDVSDPDLETKINDALEDYNLAFECDRPTVSNNFDPADLADKIFECDPADIVITMLAEAGCPQNSSSCQFTVELENTTPPMITDVPDTLFLECGNTTNLDTVNNWLDRTRAIDYLGNSITAIGNNFDFSILSSSFCNAGFDITFTALDNCGRTDVAVGRVELNDTQDPVILNCPNDTIVNADDPDLVMAVGLWLDGFSAIDVCNPQFQAYHDFDMGLLNFNCGRIDTVVTFTADDLCIETNIVTCERNLTILDNVVDQFYNFPNDTTIQCENPINVPAISTWATTTAGNSLGTTFTVENDLDVTDMRLLQCDEVIEVEFKFVNFCGIEKTQIARLSVADDIPPTITCPSDITINDQNGDVDQAVTAWLGTAFPQDNCSATAANAYDSFLFGDCTRDTITNPIIFWAQDGCGNRSDSNCEANLTLVTQKEPQISCPAPLVLECGSGNIMDTIQSWMASAVGTNFLGDDLGTTNDLLLSTLDTFSCMTETIVQFVVEDASCNRANDCMSAVTIRDTYSPTIVCPTGLTVASNSTTIDSDIQNWLESSTYEDNGCEDPFYSYDYNPGNIDFCTSTQTINITFIVTDKCGQSNSCVGLIDIDTSGPSLACPTSNLNLECGDPDNINLLNNWLQEVTAEDNSGLDLSSSVLNDYPGGMLTDTCSMTIPVLFSVEDKCGAPSQCTGTIFVADNTAPQVDCADIDPLLLLAGDTVKIPKFLNWLDLSLINTSDCNDVLLTEDFDDNLLAGFDCDPADYNLELTFTDECGWITNCQTSISVQNDIQTSFINCNPATDNFTAECGSPTFEDDIKQWMALVSAEDNLGSNFATSPDLDFSDPRLSECGASIPIIFELVDLCGNSQSCGLTLTIDDTTMPDPICPADTTFVLEDADFTVQVAEWLNSVAATDNCTAFVQEQSNYSPITSLAPCEESETIDVQFTLLDACGNSSICNSNLTVTTIKVPTISCPGNQIVECGDPNISDDINNWLDQVTGSDADNNPLDPEFVFDIAEVLAVNCDGEFPILFTVTDNCSIEDTCTATVIIQDLTPPLALCPPSITINSTDPDGTQKMQDWIDSYVPTDNCSNAIPSIQNGVIVPNILCNADEVMSVEFYAEDACGLRDTCEAIITINKAAPVISCTGDLNLQCGESGNDEKILNWLETYTGIDNNGLSIDPDNNFSSVDFTNDCESSTEVIFTLADNCGVDTTCTRLIVQKDTVSPIITLCPSDIVLDIAAPDLDTQILDWRNRFSAEDACNTTSTSDDYTLQLEAFDCGSDTLVTFTAIDECDNENNSCQANIAFINRLEVSIMCPEPLRVKCNEPRSQNEVQDFLIDFIPNSQDSWIVETSPTIEEFDFECTEIIREEITFTIIDDCGNTGDCSSYIEFIPNAQIYIPTTFSPSLSGDNGFFAVRTNIGIENITSLEIYSRWGDLMYSNSNFDPNMEQGWNGRNQHGNHVQGVYTYVLIYDDIFGNSFEKIGTITLLE